METVGVDLIDIEMVGMLTVPVLLTMLLVVLTIGRVEAVEAVTLLVGIRLVLFSTEGVAIPPLTVTTADETSEDF